MPERNNPKTSLDTYDHIRKTDMREGHYFKIKRALEKIGRGNYELIAQYSGLDKHAVNRRLGEMLRLEMVYKAGFTLPTSTNHPAQVYQLMKEEEPVSITEHTYKENEKSAGDIAANIIDMTQLNLFGNLK